MQQKTKCDLCKSDQTFFKLLYNLKDFKILQCKKCGLVFRNVILNSDESNDLYRSSYFTDEQGDYFFKNEKVRTEDFTDRIKKIEKIYQKQGKLLDVGCAMGTFMNICHKRGWDVYGQDISDYAVAYVKDKLHLKTFQGNLAQIGFEDNSFDVITLWDVIDHSEEPSLLMKEIHRILKKGGLVLLQTDMEDSFMYRLSHWLYVLTGGRINRFVTIGHPIHHSTFYALDTFKKLLEVSGFKVVDAHRTTFPKQLMSVRKKSLLLRIAYDLIDLVGNLIHRPLEGCVCGRK